MRQFSYTAENNKTRITTKCEINNDNASKITATPQNIVTIAWRNKTVKRKKNIKLKTKMVERMRRPSSY